jgi:hypothetical protein
MHGLGLTCLEACDERGWGLYCVGTPGISWAKRGYLLLEVGTVNVSVICKHKHVWGLGSSRDAEVLLSTVVGGYCSVYFKCPG